MTRADGQSHQSNASPKPRSAGTLKRRRVPVSWPAEREFRVLSIDGGGIKGIFPAAFLTGLEERYLGGQSVARYFDLVVGTSTGGIIALGLGSGLPAAQLRDLYVDRGCEVFPPPRFRRFSRAWRGAAGLVRFRYNRGALTCLLRETLGNQPLAQSQCRLCIPAMEGRYGEVYVYKTPHHADYRLDGATPMVTVGEATSAAPTFFQPLRHESGYVLVDGGVWANNPAMVGIVEALSCFDVPRHKVRLLSLGCGGSRYVVNKAKEWGGLWAWRKVIMAAMDLQSQNAVGQACLLVGAERVLRIEPPSTPAPIELDDWTRAAAELPAVAETALGAMGDDVASGFLSEPAALYEPFVK